MDENRNNDSPALLDQEPTKSPDGYVIDQEYLRQRSQVVTIDQENQDEINELILNLGNHFFNKQALGLSACQIGILKRVFVANVFSGIYFFINPSLELGEHKTASEEGCLSLPGCKRTINRSFRVKIDADLICKVDRNQIQQVEGPMELSGLDASIVQHEYDHLEGVLLIDHEEVELDDDMKEVQERSRKRQEKVAKRRQEKKLKQIRKQQKSQSISPKRQKQLDKEFKRSQKRARRRAEIQELLRSQDHGLFDATQVDKK